MKQLTHGSLFAGVGGFDEGFRSAGMRVVWQVEKEPFCKAVLRSRFPEAELLTDVRDCGKRNLRAVDVLTAGFPCQDLSVAGKRAGLEGARSGLFWEVVRILGELRPAWFVLENVPGLFSSCEGRDFAVALNALDELGYGLAWRVLNSQFFGVAQRRRRVFIVGRFGKPCPAEVLFEPESGGWDLAESGEERTLASGEIAASIGGAGRSGGYQPNAEQSAGGHLQIAVPLTSGSGVTSNRPGRRAEDDYNLAVYEPYHDEHDGRGGNFREADKHPALRGPNGTDNVLATALSASAGHHGHSSPRGDGSDNLVTTARLSPALTQSDYKGTRCDVEDPAFVIQGVREHGTCFDSQNGSGFSEGGPSYTLDGTSQHAVAYERAPTDSNRVRDFAGLPQGLDSARYRALGNAVTTKVAYWIGRRIVEAAT